MDAEEKLLELQHTIELFESQCDWCRAGLYVECVNGFDPDFGCPEEKVSLRAYTIAFAVMEAFTTGTRKGKKAQAPVELDMLPGQQLERPRHESGYVHPDAWRFDKDIGDFADPESTGRKMVKRMYPIGTGVVCEWAGKRVLGLPGGVLIGCINNPATDWHHGPDKNTLNNEKVSLGVGTQENVHIICSPCHNLAHAQIDDFYPPYDRVKDQSAPWLPLPGEWGPITLEDADDEELLEQQRRRMADARRRGRKKTGRTREVVAADAWGDED